MGIKVYIILFAVLMFYNINTANAQSKDMESLTRKEIKERFLKRVTDIPDNVTFYHSNDKDVFSVYNLISSGELDKIRQGCEIMSGILDAYHTSYTSSDKRKIELSFFAREKFFDSLFILKKYGMLTDEMDKYVKELLSNINLCEERGPNNRAANYAMGALSAAQLYPDHPKAGEWRSYALAVWNDWYIPGDSYEPCYVAHNIPRLISLGKRLGKEKELKSDRLRKVYYRYRDQVSPSGLVCSPGDGEPYDMESYVKAFSSIMEVCPDPTILWALKKVYLAGNIKTGRRLESSFYEAFPQYKKMKEKEPKVSSAVQLLFPDTYKSKDRIILSPSRESGKPFAQFWIQDDCNILYHGGVSDTRADLTHYEVDGTMIIADRGRYEWPAWNNVFLVSEPDAEYPFRQTSGVHDGRWYNSSANLRMSRVYLPSSNYNVDSNHSGASVSFGLIDVNNPLGFSWGNPKALSGKADNIQLDEVKIEFALIPIAGEKSVGKIFKGRTWFGGYEYRNVCPSDIPVDVYIKDLFIAGKKGEKILVPFDEITSNFKFSFINPDEKQEFTEIPLSASDYSIVIDPETGKKVLRITTRHGRTVMRIRMNEKFNLTDDYSRMGLSYKYVTPIEGWTRVPIQLSINNHDLQFNMRLDRQQGGIMEDAKTITKGGDSYGEVSYREIWTHDSEYKRQMLLTEEGVLVVLDEFKPGKKADGLVGGPVWHVPSSPICGDADGSTARWFDASLHHYPSITRAFTNKYGEADKRLFITFVSPLGSENGIQYQPKHWKNDDYAIFSKHSLHENKPLRWLTVMIPHDKNISVRKVAQSLKSTEKDGVYNINVGISDKYWKKSKNIEILIDNLGNWNVKRKP